MQIFRTAEELIRNAGAGRNIIYGAGWVGQIVCEFLQNKGVEVEAFAETRIKEKRTLRKVPVLSLDDALNQNPFSKNIILSVWKPQYQAQMESELKKRGIFSYYAISEALVYGLIREIIKVDAEKSVDIIRKNKSQKVVGHLDTEYFGAEHAEKRLIINKIEEASYIRLPWETAEITCIGTRLEENIIAYRQILEACYQPQIDISEIDMIHTCNAVCAANRPWIASFETKMPRMMPQTAQEEEYWRCLIDCMKQPNCKALYALSQNAYNIQKHSLMSKLSFDDAETIMRKTKVLHPPQKILVTKEEFEKKHNTQKIHFIFCGGSFFLKGGREIIQALSGFEGKYEFELTLISTLLYDDYFTRTPYEEMIRCRDLIKEKSWIHYYESLPNAEVLEKCKEADVGLLPSLADTYGYAILEMQAAGCPVITSNVRAMPEINNEECGWVCHLPVNDLGFCLVHDVTEWSPILDSELTKCLQKIFEHPEEIKKKGKKALERIRNMHDPQKYQNELRKNIF